MHNFQIIKLLFREDICYFDELKKRDLQLIGFVRLKNEDVLCCSINKYKDGSFGYFVNNNRDTVDKLKEGISTFEGCYKDR